MTMLALVTITYTAPMDRVAEVTPDHRAYAKSLHERGKLVASGPFDPRTGGAQIYRVANEAEAKAIAEADPFQRGGVARFDVRVWSPTIGAETLEGR